MQITLKLEFFDAVVPTVANVDPAAHFVWDRYKKRSIFLVKVGIIRCMYIIWWLI